LRAFRLGLEVSGTGIRNDFATPDKAKRAEGVQHAKQWIEVAAKMGAPVIRVFAGQGPAQGYTREQVATWMVESLSQCVEHGKKFGVVVGVQNHGDFLQTADEVLEIVRMVDSEWFGVIVDTGFFLTPDPYEDIARVLPYAVNWQIKETLKGKESGIKTDLRRLVHILREGGYRGYIPIETLSIAGKPYDPVSLVPRFLGQLKEALATA
jgi:sugar phosphate isomerase/epimerase